MLKSSEGEEAHKVRQKRHLESEGGETWIGLVDHYDAINQGNMILYTEKAHDAKVVKTLLQHDGADVYVRYNPDYKYEKEKEEFNEIEDDYGEEEGMEWVNYNLSNQ